MRRNHPQRLDRLEAKLIVQSRAAADAFDLSRLSEAEQQELDRLAGKTRRLPTGRWDFSALDDAELDQLRDLVAKGQAVTPDARGGTLTPSSYGEGDGSMASRSMRLRLTLLVHQASQSDLERPGLHRFPTSAPPTNGRPATLSVPGGS